MRRSATASATLLAAAGLCACCLSAGVAHAEYRPLPAHPAPAASPPVAGDPLDQEVWAGISWRDAMAGAAVLGGGAVVVAVVTGSTTLAVAAAAAAAVTFIVYDPGAPGVVSPSDLPSSRAGKDPQ